MACMQAEFIIASYDRYGNMLSDGGAWCVQPCFTQAGRAVHCRGWPGGYERVQSVVSACGPWRSYTVTIEGEAVIPTVVHDLGNGRYKVTYIPYSPGRTLPGTEGCAQGRHACSRLDRAALCCGRKAQSRRRGWQGRIKSWCRCGSNPGADVGRRAFRSAADRRTSRGRPLPAHLLVAAATVRAGE